MKSFLRQFLAVLLQNKIDNTLGIDPAFGGIPVSKPENFLPSLFKIKIDLTPFAAAVCLVFVDCCGDFLFHMAAGHADAVAFFQEIPVLGRAFFKG